MGCGCSGKSSPGTTEFVVRYADGTVSGRFSSEAEAKVALARTGKTGVVKPAPARA